MRSSTLLFTVRLLIVCGLIVGPVVFASHQQKQMRNFRVVREGVLYRSGQMSPEGLRRAIHDYGIRTVVSFRDAKVPGGSPPDAFEEEYCTKLGMKYVRIGPLAWEGDNGKPAPVQKGVDTFLSVMRDPKNHPVLVHCFAGTHRTGGYCAVFRIEFDGWSNDEALKELKANGYPHVEEEKDIFRYLSNYQRKQPDSVD
jgi:tyrosine-protein phosphatase SIW14